MKAAQSTMNDFFSLANTFFAIPVYQRNYTWSKENCAKLLTDIVGIAKDLDKTHFLGTITFIVHLVQEQDTLRQIQEYVIIDGQQRITTTMLLLKAIERKVSNATIKEEIGRILNSGDARLRLKPIERDREAFKLVMDDRFNEYTGKSKIKENYHFFLKELDEYIKQGYTIEEIYGAFLRLKIVGIGLEKGDDDPQVVFESINATGVKLEGLDLIRNYLMMGEDSKQQEKLYGEYWKPIEEWLEKEVNVQDFIESYLRIYHGSSMKKDSIYDEFKKHHKEYFSDNIESLMKDLRNYGKIYQIFLQKDYRLANPEASDRELVLLKEKIEKIVGIKFGVSYPFIMRIARDYERGYMDFENFHTILETLISYYVRRLVCREASNALNKVMYVLYRDLKKMGGVNAENLKQYLGQKSGKEVFPNNERIKRNFIECDAYALKSVNKLILVEIEKLSNVEPPREDGLNIEHFYPQSATRQWRELVGEDWELLESTYRNTFGNLSLTGQNVHLGNKSFDEKLELLNERGSLHLNEYFVNMTTWGIEEIKIRSKYLAERFCEVGIFADIPKEYRIKPAALTLNDDLTSGNFGSIRFPNRSGKNIKGAKELVKSVIEYLYEQHQEDFEHFVGNYEPKCITWNKEEADPYHRPGRLCVGFRDFYFISNASLRDVGKNLVQLIEGCNLEPRDFVLE